MTLSIVLLCVVFSLFLSPCVTWLGCRIFDYFDKKYEFEKLMPPFEKPPYIPDEVLFSNAAWLGIGGSLIWSLVACIGFESQYWALTVSVFGGLILFACLVGLAFCTMALYQGYLVLAVVYGRPIKSSKYVLRTLFVSKERRLAEAASQEAQEQRTREYAEKLEAIGAHRNTVTP